jgi:hypothetical protein
MSSGEYVEAPWRPKSGAWLLEQAKVTEAGSSLLSSLTLCGSASTFYLASLMVTADPTTFRHEELVKYQYLD